MFRLPVAARRRERLWTRHAVIALGALLVAAYGASTALLLRWSYVRAIDAARATLESTARSAAIGTARSLFETDAMLIGIERIVATALGDRQLDATALGTVLREFDAQSLSVSDILVLDNKGHLANRSNPTGPASDYSASPFFTAHRQGDPARLFIGAPEASTATGKWSITMSRPLTRGDARVGVIAAEIPTASFGDFYRAIAPAGGTRLALLRDDGILIVAEPPQDAAIGHKAPFAAARPRDGAKDAALSNRADGTKAGELRAFRRVSGYPLTVSASRPAVRALAGWDRECLISMTGFALFAATVVALAWIAVVALGRSQLAAARLFRSEAGLKRQAALLQSTLDGIEEGLSVFDGRGRLAAHNRQFNRLLELPSDLAVGTTLADILMRQAMRGDFGEVDAATETARRRDDFYREVPVTRERVTPAGRTLQIRRRRMVDGGVLSVYTDITDLKESEGKILQARSQAEAANRAKGEFLANMSHELRTPLNAIIGFSEIIFHELFGPVSNQRYLEYVKDIHSSSLHLLSIINDVLDMSKIEAGKLDLAKEAVSLQHVIGEVVRMMRERAAIRGILLVAEVAPDDVVCWADTRALKQVLLNLLSNAIKFSDAGGTVMLRLAAESGFCAVIEVEDRGIGMTVEEQERALQPFGQAKPVITREYGGTGLGLPITKGLVEAHGGTLTIRSQVGSGTLVRITLPIETPPARSEPGQPDAAQSLHRV